MNTIKIRTTQNVEVEYAMASVGDRIIAYIIDSVVFFVWMMALIMLQVTIGYEAGPIYTFILMVPLLFYHPLCEFFLNGQSIGKKARDIKVIKVSGEAPTIGDYLLRWLFRLVDITISSGLVAVVTVAASDKGQRLGDMAAGTCVIRKEAVRRKNRVMVKTEEGYQVIFPEVSLLTDKDVALIRQLLYKARQHNNYELLEKIALRVKETTGIQTEMPDWDFLQTVVKDYHHYTHGDLTV
ncbi:RDD family protein [Pontibacter rugosus]|uniref:RDD family protein n=1 Tax=Pontibacter rugosus TaxID=1745966 RepID=A0ABW3SRN4_9BACT